ncbi:hypothetical protein ACO2Q3_12615 [Caulobacter sp. KR2-114]|uniref:hypothetical protein n=1 Tax=Caulobacter sp. KR2-114 TaxID=3400912 RepID=UPI003C0953DD
MFSVIADRSPPRPPPPARQRARRWRETALVASLAFHGALVALFVLGAAGEVVTGGGGGTPEESAITISLAGIAGSRQSSSASEPDRLQALYQKALSAQSDLYATDKPAPQQSNLSKLFDDIERQHAGDSQADGTNGKSDNGRETGAGQKGAEPKPNPSRLAANGPGTAASSGALWGQVEPCWRRMPDKSQVPVRLQVQLTAKGQIARPPTILRPDSSQPDQRRLIAEARALAAIAACIPYKTADLRSDAIYTLDFSPSGR